MRLPSKQFFPSKDIVYRLHRSTWFCYGVAEVHFRSNFWRKNRIRAQNCSISSSFRIILTWKCEKHGFSLYFSIDNFTNFYYFLNMRKPSKRATFQLSISLFTSIIIIFLTGDIADWKKKLQVSQWPIYGGKKMIGRQICFFILIWWWWWWIVYIMPRSSEIRMKKQIWRPIIFSRHISVIAKPAIFFSIGDISGQKNYNNTCK